MENLTKSSLSEYSFYLTSVLSNKTEDVRAATDKLQAMAENPTQLIDSFMMIVLSEEESEEINMKVKHSACVILSSLLPRILEKDLEIEKKNYIAKAIVTTMYSPNVSLSLKKDLQSAIKLLYNLDKSAILCTQGLQMVKSRLGSDQISDSAASLLIFQAIINVPQVTIQAIVDWFFDLMTTLVSCGQRIVQGLDSEIKELVLNSNEGKVQDICNGLKLLEMWIMIMQDLFRLLTQNYLSSGLVQGYLEVFINTSSFIQMFSSILEMQVLTSTQMNLCLLSTSNISSLDESLNQIKTRVLKIFNSFLKVANSKKSEADFSKTKFFIFFKDDGMKGVLNSLFLFCKSSSFDLEKVLEDRAIHECVVECLIFLTKLTDYNDFDGLFSECLPQLMIDIILPLMRSTSKELHDFIHNQSEFVNFSLDTCTGQESQTVKTQAAQFLENVCQNTDGSLTYIVHLLINIMDFTIASESQGEVNIQFEQDIVHSKFMSQTEPKIRLETCLIGLSTINYLFCERDDLIELLENWIGKHWNILTSKDSNRKGIRFFEILIARIALIKARLCLFIENYIDILFQLGSQEEMFKAFLIFVLESMAIQGEEFGALSEQAVEALLFILQQDHMTLNLVEFLDDIFKLLISYMKIIKSKRFYEALEVIQENFSFWLRQNPEQLHLFLITLVEMAQEELEKKRFERKERSILLYRAWNIIRSMSENKLYMAHYHEDLEKVLMPLFNYFTNEEQTPFDDEILKYTISSIRLSKKVSGACWMLFQAFPKRIKRDGVISSLMFTALIEFIIHGRDMIDSDAGALEVIINTTLEAIATSQAQGEEVEISRGALVLQFLIQYFDNISDSDFSQIIKVCIEALNLDDIKGYVRSKLEGVVLSASLRRFELTENILMGQNLLKIIDLFIQDIQYFDENLYERKLIVVGLSNFLRQRNVNNFANKIPSILNALVSMLKYIQYSDSQKAKKGRDPTRISMQAFSNPQLLSKFLSDASEEFFAREEEEKQADPFSQKEESSEDDDDGDSDDSEEMRKLSRMDFDNAEVNDLINSVDNGMKDKDEFVFFKESFHLFKLNNQLDTNQLLETFREPKRKFLKEILASQRVVIDNNAGKTLPRKIVKPKTRKVAGEYLPEEQ